MLKSQRILSALAGLALLSACSATADINITASPKPSTSPSAQTSASPSPQTSSSPSASPQASSTPVPDGTPIPVASASAGFNTKLLITGSDAFGKYKVDYAAGQKWVYKMSLKGLSIALPTNLPGGVSIPGVGSGGDMEIGTWTMEVLKVEGNLVTIKSTVNNTQLPVQVPPSTSTFDKNDTKSTSSMFVQNSNDAQGTISWTAGAAESVTVPNGSFAAEVLNGAVDITTTAGAKLNQNIKVWMAPGVGMVKQEAVTNISGGASTNSTAIIELQSRS